MQGHQKQFSIKVNPSALPLKAKDGSVSLSITCVAHAPNKGDRFTWFTIVANRQIMAVAIQPTWLMNGHDYVVKQIFSVLDRGVPAWVKNYVIDNKDTYHGSLTDLNRNAEWTI